MTASTHPFPPLPITRWTLDPSMSTVEFSVRQLWGLSAVRGRINRLEGALEISEDGHGSAELRIEAASIETGNRRRDKHLRGPDYFACDHHPLVRFLAATVRAPGQALRFTGELQAAGRSIELDLAATVEGGDEWLELTAGTSIDARELGMTWSPAGNLRTPAALDVRARLRRAA